MAAAPQISKLARRLAAQGDGKPLLARLYREPPEGKAARTVLHAGVRRRPAPRRLAHRARTLLYVNIQLSLRLYW